jgi:imidazolonepropionase-like amidohydrolase
MVREGMAPRDAIVAATSGAARAIGVGDEVGSIEPGRRADLIAVPQSPLDHVDALQRVEFVMQGGEVVVDRRPSAGPEPVAARHSAARPTSVDRAR